MPVLQEHIVPQEVTKYQFKIFAGLTWKQFLVVGGGGALAYLFYYFGKNNLLNPFLSMILAFFSFFVPIVSLFVKVEGTPLVLLVGRFLGYLKTAPLRVWKKPNTKSVKYPNRLKNKPTVFPAYFSLYFKPGQKPSKLSKEASTIGIIEINDNYIQRFSNASIKTPPTPNAIPLQIFSAQNTPLQNAEVLLLNKDGKALYKGISNQHGIVYFKNPLPNGVYFIQIKHPNAVFPAYKITLNGKQLPVIKITANQNG